MDPNHSKSHPKRATGSKTRWTCPIPAHPSHCCHQKQLDKRTTTALPTSKKSKSDWANECTLATKIKSETSKFEEY